MKLNDFNKIKYNGVEVDKVKYNNILVWSKPPIVNSYITFQSEDNLDFTLKTYNETANWDGTIEYTTNLNLWHIWDGTTISSVNGKLYLRGTNNTYITGTIVKQNGRFVLGGSSTSIQCNGNIENLLDYPTVLNGEHIAMVTYGLSYLFSENQKLTIPPEFPSLILNTFCYSDTFKDCTNLRLPSSLPATTLAMACYIRMMQGCTNLTTLPLLPATKMTSFCYASIVKYCSNIKISETQTDDCPYAFRIPTSGTGVTAGAWNDQIFIGTGGTFTGAPNLNTTYYTNNQPI